MRVLGRTTLSGRTVAITGGARGIGLSTARALTAAGALVAIVDRDLDATEAAVRGLSGKAIALPLDVSEERSVEQFLKESEKQLGALHALVNNAPIAVFGPLIDESPHATNRQIDINLRGVIHGVKAAAPRMRELGDGHLVIVASTAGKLALPGAATYCATKYALLGLGEALRSELRGAGVRVSLVLPHMTRTEMISGQTEIRGMAPIPPDRVARAIVSVLRRPRPTAYVPAVNRPLLAIAGLVPTSVRDAALRALGANRAFDYEPGARASYHERALNEPRKA
jgi:NAD(P)-dependent dehydrogenase (short-subunit alcohol dehydrogenase family)